MVGVKQKDTTKPKSGRKEDLLLAGNKENTGDPSQGSVSPTAKLGKFYTKGVCIFTNGPGQYMHIHEGVLSRGIFKIELRQRLTESKL